MATTLSWWGGRGRGTGERLPLAAVLSSSSHTQQRDEAAQRTCAGLLSYYTWATPVTVKATPSAVSTSSQRGCNVIISREILPRNAKQGHGSGGPRAWGVGRIQHLTAPAGMGWGPATEGWGNALRACGEECVRRCGRRQSSTGVACYPRHTCPLLRAAWLAAWGKEAEKWVGVAWAGWGVAGVVVCGWPGNAPEVLVPPAVLCWSSAGVMGTSLRGLRLILGLLGTLRYPGKLCLLAWLARSLLDHKGGDPVSAPCRGSPSWSLQLAAGLL